MTDWTAEQKMVYDDIKAEGFEIVVRTPGDSGEFDSVVLEYFDGGDSSDITTYGLKKAYKASQVDGKIIQQNDTILLFPAYGLPAIQTTHEVLIGGEVQDVVSFNAIEPGNIPLFYEAQIRS